MKKLQIALMAMLMTVACQTPSGYKISGLVDGAKDGQAVLKKVENGQPVPIDTAEIKDGSFTFEGDIAQPLLHLIYINQNQNPIVLFAEKANIKISAEIDSLGEAQIKGSKSHDLFADFNKNMPGVERMKNFQAEFMQARAANDSVKMGNMREEYMGIVENQKKYFTNFVETNTTNAIGAYLALNMSSSLELDSLKAQIEKFENGLGSHPYIDGMKEILKPLEDFQKAQELTEVGQAAPAFSITSLNGKEVSPASFKGKILLLDFWASWCKPCRQENPNVVKAYEKFNGKGFEILGVSLDRDSAQWKEAIAADGLVWAQAFDSEGTIATQYGVQSIPHTVLIDKNGVIIEKNLRGEALTAKLKELLN